MRTALTAPDRTRPSVRPLVVRFDEGCECEHAFTVFDAANCGLFERELKAHVGDAAGTWAQVGHPNEFDNPVAAPAAEAIAAPYLDRGAMATAQMLEHGCLPRMRSPPEAVLFATVCG